MRFLPLLPLLALPAWAVTTLSPAPTPTLFSSIIETKLQAIANVLKSPASYPQYTDRVQGIWQFFDPTTWTSGFFPATLYELDTRAKLCPSFKTQTDFLGLGRTWSQGEVPLETDSGLDHDVGFLSYPFMHELLVNPSNTSAQNAVIKFGNFLASRFDPIVGCTRSWNTADPTDFQVIIDNMMNLEVLFAAADLTGNQTLRDIAITHADTTMKNHFRPDWSTWHVVEYNSTTGAIIRKRTEQGFSDNSTWTRGQSWAVYGYANMFNRTRLTRYLDTARNAADLYLTRTPSSFIVPWDFDAPLPLMADTSASTIAATGLLLLADMEESLSPPNSTGAARWRTAAVNLLNAAAKLAWSPSWQSLLSNGTVNNPAANNLTGIVYGDYYFIKAGNVLLSEGFVRCP
ncbi:glycoside hydrolase family 88 protein [Sphaerobolus stellatus SS14]|uniref:Glycoside hydrolase family 88 protein n=1 Tax=Sphaerobolus stellatus (strain SS14) TaxID=990650 RepID=A0A0C9VB72_SPHS4|nr:glycoside hydrolase family 88 protein [Sphaerobolus stellatus SS14]